VEVILDPPPSEIGVKTDVFTMIFYTDLRGVKTVLSYVVRGVIIFYANSTSPMYGVFKLPCISSHGYTGHAPFLLDWALCPITSIRPNVVPPSITTFLQLPRYVHGPHEHVLVLRSLLLTCPLAFRYHCRRCML
jgi:hypothetical protein